MTVPTRHANNVKIWDIQQFFGHFNGRNTRAARHSMPALFKGVANTHPLILSDVAYDGSHVGILGWTYRRCHWW
jgi:hypothetical protein